MSVGIDVPSRIFDWVLNIGGKDWLTGARLSGIKDWGLFADGEGHSDDM